MKQPWDPVCQGPQRSSASGGRYIKMQDIFPNAKFCIERNGWIVPEIGLDKDHIGPAFRCYLLHMFNEPGGDALTAMTLIDRQIVNVDFAAFPFEFPEFVGSQSADNGPASQSGDRDERISAQQVFKIGVPRLHAAIGRLIFEGTPEHGEHLPKQGEINR